MEELLNPFSHNKNRGVLIVEEGMRPHEVFMKAREIADPHLCVDAPPPNAHFCPVCGKPLISHLYVIPLA